MANAQTTLLLPMLNGPDAPMVLHGSKNPIPDDDTAVALVDFVENDFPGYAPIPLNDFGETDIADADVGEALTDVIAFQASEELVNAQLIYFLYVTRHPLAAPVQLAQVIALPEPVNICELNQRFELRVRVNAVGLA